MKWTNPSAARATRAVKAGLIAVAVSSLATIPLPAAAEAKRYSDSALCSRDNLIITVKPGYERLAARSVGQTRIFGANAFQPRSLNGGKHVVLPRPIPAGEVAIANASGLAPCNVVAHSCDQALRDYSDFAYACSPDHVMQLFKTPNDSLFKDLYGMNSALDADINAPEAWDRSTGANVIVAVIDTGVDYTHPDLAAHMFKNPNEVPGNGIDDDANGCIDDTANGCDFADMDNDPKPGHLHGTHVAGTAAGIGDNGLGVVGAAYNAEILAVKVFKSGSDQALLSYVANGINYATAVAKRSGKRMVINLSLGGHETEAVLNHAVRDAIAANVVVVAAAGNEAGDNDFFPMYPANLPGVISVGATDQNGDLTYFSNYGAGTVDVAAPGAEILSTVPNGGYETLDGTSMACPHVSGVVALMLSRCPGINPAQVDQFLRDTAKRLPGLEGATRSGLVKADNAIKACEGAPGPIPTPTATPENTNSPLPTATPTSISTPVTPSTPEPVPTATPTAVRTPISKVPSYNRLSAPYDNIELRAFSMRISNPNSAPFRYEVTFEGSGRQSLVTSGSLDGGQTTIVILSEVLPFDALLGTLRFATFEHTARPPQVILLAGEALLAIGLTIESYQLPLVSSGSASATLALPSSRKRSELSTLFVVNDGEGAGNFRYRIFSNGTKSPLMVRTGTIAKGDWAAALIRLPAGPSQYRVEVESDSGHRFTAHVVNGVASLNALEPVKIVERKRKQKGSGRRRR